MFWYDDDDDDVDLSLNTKFYFMYDVFIVMVWWWLWIIFTDLEIQQKLLMKFRLIVLIPYLVKQTLLHIVEDYLSYYHEGVLELIPFINY